ncbi:MAG: DUF2782 domain-containing protein [Gammaproteobacteria bacterium]|jgi:hypothetical protein|nr:DUF2782 domain-containing protein [Gammaproteobacteria bacterium]
MRHGLLLAGMVLALPLHAQQGGQALDAPPPPPPVESGEVLEADVKIIRKGEATHHEYRVNGRLYMIRIEPDVGPPYYLVDRDGDGEFESRRQRLGDELLVPQWVIKRF